MPAASVIVQATRFNPMDDDTTTTNIGGGAAEGAEPDIVYQGATSISRKVGTAERGFYASGTAQDITTSTGTYQTTLFKVTATNPAALLTQASAGLNVLVGSGTGDYHQFNILGRDNYPVKGGWVISPIDANIHGYADASTGTPNLATADFFAIQATFTGTSRAENLVMDAVDIGNGMTVVHGSTNAPAVFQDFIDYDEGTVNNRYGFVTTSEGIIFNFGTLQIASAGTSCVFSDSAQTIVFPDGRFAAGWTGIGVDLTNAATSVTFDGCTFLGRGNETTTDTRPIFTITGTGGNVYIDGNTFDNFASITLNRQANFEGNSVVNSEGITQSSALISGNTFSNSPVSSNEAMMTVNNLGNIKDSTFIAGASGHAMELTATGTVTVSGLTFTGYAIGSSPESAVYNNSGGLVVWNVAGGNSPSVRNGTGASTVVNNPVFFNYTGLVSGSEVRIYESANNSAVAGVENSSATFQYSYNYAADKVVYSIIFHLNYKEVRFPSLTLGDTDQTIPIQQITDRVYSNP